MYLPKKIISGGQDGADLGGLLAAKELGIETGGTAPKGYRTVWGSNLDLKDFNLVESYSSSYVPRTKDNVLNSDATLIICFDENSAGTIQTLNFCKRYNKPYFIFNVSNILNRMENENNCVNWFLENPPEVLNVAGNRNKLEYLCDFTELSKNVLSGVLFRLKEYG